MLEFVLNNWLSYYLISGTIFNLHIRFFLTAQCNGERVTCLDYIIKLNFSPELELVIYMVLIFSRYKYDSKCNQDVLAVLKFWMGVGRA